MKGQAESHHHGRDSAVAGCAGITRENAGLHRRLFRSPDPSCSILVVTFAMTLVMVAAVIVAAVIAVTFVPSPAFTVPVAILRHVDVVVPVVPDEVDRLA